MRVAVYNQMFGLNGKSFLSNVMGHYFVHWQKHPEKVHRRTDLDETIKIVERSKADLLGLCEIYEGQEEEICQGLQGLGYKYFYFGEGHKFKYSDKHVMELLVSKFEGEQLDVGKWPLENKIGGGGGFVVCKFKEPEINVLHVHLGIPIRNFFQDQIKYMKEIVDGFDEGGGRSIVMGDFNYSWKDLQKHFPDFSLVSAEMKTCSMTPIMKKLYNKDVDHIAVKGIDPILTGCLGGRSDHKLIYADLK